MREKINNLVSDQVRHKTGCTVTEDGKRLEILYLSLLEEGLYYKCSENKGADQLRGYREADLRLCFRPSIFVGFLMQWLILYRTCYMTTRKFDNQFHNFLW